jgi:hypothetical protein
MQMAPQLTLSRRSQSHHAQVKAKIVSLKKLPGVVCMNLKAGKALTLKCESEKERATWIGLLNAPVGFVPTKKMIADASK